LLAERGIEVSYESARLWCHKLGPLFSKRLRRKHPGFGDTFFIDEVFITITGQRYYLWRAVDQDSDDSRYRSPCEQPGRCGRLQPVQLNAGTKQLQREDGETPLLTRSR